jgi:HEAT repeat protein
VSLSRLRISILLSGVAVCAVLSVPSSFAVSGQQKAWALFESAAQSKSAAQRAIGIRALGLLRDNAHARKLAEGALEDDRPEVRSAGAVALGQMHAIDSIPKLQKLLKDDRMSVVMSAAHSLRDLKDNASAYSVYYDILTGERKGDGLVAQQMDTLHNPKELAMIGLEQGIGYVPFAGIGWDAWRYTHKKDPHPVRAVAATLLAHDPDPKSSAALVKAALNDKDWIVRAAALEAIAERGDPSLEDKIEVSLYDVNSHVRFTAAATVIRLNALRKLVRKEIEKKTATTQAPAVPTVSASR